MTPLVLVVTFLAHYRATLLLSADKITSTPRGYLHNRLMDGNHHSLAWLIECPWCVGMYLAVPAVWSAIEWSNGWGWWLVMGSLAASGVTGFLATFASPDA